MPLTEQQLTAIMNNHGLAGKISTGEPITRGRAVLRPVSLLAERGEGGEGAEGGETGASLQLLEKVTAAQAEPVENAMYRLFGGRKASLPKVFYNAYDALTEEGILLLEDLTPTHGNIADWNAPLEAEPVHRLLELIAGFHAEGWGERGLPLPQHLESLEKYLEHLGYVERDYAHFRQYYPFRLGAEEYSLYENSLRRLQENAGGYIERIHARRHTTILHGDLNACNVLYPAVPGAIPVLIDLEAVRIGLCTEDLVMLFVHDFYHGGAGTLEILRQYYGLLNAQVGSSYGWELFMQDMQWSLMEGLFFPAKLLAHEGVQDEELVWKSIQALRGLLETVV
ncbi:phosphotransferase [Paenibacillus tepidiphilus]|uniref:phosphotransferase n=1 Tax=Paenibacillus tepidiphilus TaxID=2608683 RepID=UPI0013A52C37|nr:phosphotransferase [Paenibacillus tepidiphilus]